MELLCLILFLSVAASWFFANEYDILFGVYTPTCAMTRRCFNSVVFICLLSALWKSRRCDVTESVQACLPGALDARTIIVIILSSMIVLMVLKSFRIRGSAIYAVLGALGACSVISGGEYDPHLSFPLSFVAAPLMTFVLSSAIRAFFRAVFSKVKVHLITMSYYMRLAVIFSIVLTVYALGLNWGGLLFGVSSMIADEKTILAAVLVVVGIVMLLSLRIDKGQNDEPYGPFADFSIYAVVSVGLSVAVVMMFFSFRSATSLVGLAPVPLSVSSLVIAAIAGAESAQKTRLVGNLEYVKESVAFIAVPFCSFVLTYLIFHIIGGETADHLVDFVVIGAAMLILVALIFAGYVRGQRAQKAATDRLVYVQQQQIYEHSRALNDMELKVILSENQALHNSVEMKKQEVMNVALSIVEQREYLESLNDIVKKLSSAKDDRERDRLVSELSASLKQRLSYDRDVDSQYFYAQAESLHEDFNAKLSENFPQLTPQDRRLATLLRLGFSSKYIATLMNITPKSVEISRYRLRQKLGLAKGDNLVNYIKSI